MSMDAVLKFFARNRVFRLLHDQTFFTNICAESYVAYPCFTAKIISQNDANLPKEGK